MSHPKMIWRFAVCLFLILGWLSHASADVVVSSNGNFETGDTSGWEFFPNGSGTFEATQSDVHFGVFSGKVDNPTEGTASVIKQANLAVGLVDPGDEISISFFAKGTYGDGGVSFVQFFSELDGGGVSKDEILLTLTTSSNSYQMYSFTTTAGPDVSGGITLQFTATTGATAGSTATLFVDNVVVSVPSAVPEPTAFALLGLSGIGMLLRRRR